MLYTWKRTMMDTLKGDGEKTAYLESIGIIFSMEMFKKRANIFLGNLTVEYGENTT